MNAKKYLISVIVVFVVYSALAYFIHGVLLEPEYKALPLTREFEQLVQRIPLLYLANLIFSLVFCYIYVQGYEPDKNWLGQGLRYGLLLGTLLAPVALVGYVALPVTFSLTSKLIALNYLQSLGAGITVALLYREPPLVRRL